MQNPDSGMMQLRGYVIPTRNVASQWLRPIFDLVTVFCWTLPDLLRDSTCAMKTRLPGRSKSSLHKTDKLRPDCCWLFFCVRSKPKLLCRSFISWIEFSWGWWAGCWIFSNFRNPTKHGRHVNGKTFPSGISIRLPSVVICFGSRINFAGLSRNNEK